MKYFDFCGVNASRVAQGCMRIGEMSKEEINRFMNAALEGGINFFDHADIYGGGACEEKFGDFLMENPSLREDIIIQTKCGIQREPKTYNFSKEYIISAVEGSLKRLKTDYVDFLLLHRPDTLVEPEEVAEAFDLLYLQGKVKNFGVSNQNPMQMELLSKYLGKKLVANQLQFGLGHTGMVDIGINVNMKNEEGINRDSDILSYCRLKDIVIQPWSPFQTGFFGGSFIDNPQFPLLNETLQKIAQKYGITPTGLAIAWILRHPAQMQPIIGTVNPDRIRQVCAASDTEITHGEWYELYMAAGKKLP